MRLKEIKIMTQSITQRSYSERSESCSHRMVEIFLEASVDGGGSVYIALSKVESRVDRSEFELVQTKITNISVGKMC